MEKQGSDRYVPRIYLTEGSGAVLGANFMQDQLVVFDEQHNRVGIGRANCEYSNFIRGDKSNITKVNVLFFLAVLFFISFFLNFPSLKMRARGYIFLPPSFLTYISLSDALK